GVSIGGYGEALYEDFSAAKDDGKPSGKTDRLDFLRGVLYFGYKFTDSILFNSEIEYEHATTGEGAEEKGEISVEFANIEFLLRRQANIRAGELLVPVGFTNELHEPTTFPGARRPDVERAIIPATWREVGAGVFGESGAVAYRAYVVAGLKADRFEASGIREGRQQGSQSTAEDLALTGRIDWDPAPGLTLGGSFFSGDSGQGLADPARRAIDARTTVAEGHAAWRWEGLEARGLYARTRIGDVTRLNGALGLSGAESIGRSQSGWYVQASFDVLARRSEQSFVPFARYERYDTQREVPNGFQRDPENDIWVTTAGVAWKPIPNVVVKADYQDFRNRAGTGTDQVN
ncbi:MAG: hypothetical protein ACRD1Z_00710, partial [Vicinamibacteria bacterium]